EQTEPGFYSVANYEELYVMGSQGVNRAQLQILNLYDPCCFYGSNYVYWVDDVKTKVQELRTGNYDFFSDDSHHEHKTSPVALGVILDSLPPTLDRIADLTLTQNAGPQAVALTGVMPALLGRTNTIVI